MTKKEYRRSYYLRNKDKARDLMRVWRKNNPEKVKAQRAKETRGLRIRFKILQRDNFTCQYCGRKAPEVILQVDHIHPRSEGGLDREDNFITACLECNIGKSNLIY